MSASKEAIKQLKVKTGTVTRCLKDLAYTDKEIKSQLERIEKVRQDPEKDEHDVRKQEEVLAEYTTAKPFEQGQLHGYFTALEEKVLEALEDDDLKATEEFSKGVEALNAAAPVLIECGKLEQEDWDATLAQLPAVATPPPPAPA